MSGWYFWPILGFVGFSAVAGGRGFSKPASGMTNWNRGSSMP